jgi:hypothetical protein
MPAAIDGKWYIYYKGSYAWSHFEAPQAKGTTGMPLTNSHDILVYPNPFNNEIFININNTEGVENIEILNSLGQLIIVIDKQQIVSGIINLQINNHPEGIYILKIKTPTTLFIKQIIKKK